MRILIEGYQYRVSDISSVLHGIDAMENIEGKVTINYVGYYYNTLLDDCVFILPKVLLKDEGGEEKVLGLYKPEEVVDLREDGPLKSFLYKFAVWIYRAIVVYKNDNCNESSIIYHTKIARLGGHYKRITNTYLDVLLSLIQFNRDNQQFFFTTVKNIHSGHNKINWTRTVNSRTAYIQDSIPVYLNPVNKKRVINFDEELIIIFYSILNYISDTYGFPKPTTCNYQLITGKHFRVYLSGLGKNRLRQIKYKYYSDKALQLWQLCYHFFDEAGQVCVSATNKEYLLAKNFYVVFEAIIDKLISDNPLPDGMKKEQEDGKVVDHLFTSKSLLNASADQYYIGDSKYYKIGHNVSPESVYKQYTYARNVIQSNLDIFNEGKTPESGIELRDNLTEGYNIVPNFFISSKLDEDLDYGRDGIEKSQKTNNKYKKLQFQNRLFDRDTLLVYHYDVNFLFVLSLYARSNVVQMSEWRSKVREKFRVEIQGWLNEDYDFYVLSPRKNIDVEQYITHNFKKLIGKIYKPYKDESIYSLALEKSTIFQEENQQLLEYLTQSFYVEKCLLGENMKAVVYRDKLYKCGI